MASLNNNILQHYLDLQFHFADKNFSITIFFVYTCLPVSKCQYLALSAKKKGLCSNQ